jgi:hypothetical protein
MITNEATYSETVAFLKELFPLEVRQSTIEGAGNGVFSVDHITAGDTIAVYDGMFFSSLVNSSIYSYQFEDGYVVEPYITTTVRFINDIIDLPFSVKAGYVVYFDIKRNVKFEEVIVDDKLHVLYVVATKDILPGEELFINYSMRYWQELLKIGDKPRL